MSKPTPTAVTVLNRQQAERVERIKSYHQGCLKSFGDQMGFAFLAGAELMAAKAEVPHGGFMAWCEENLPALPHRTATNYMSFAEKLVTHRQITSQSNLKLLGNGELPENKREQILAAVHDEADGQTLTELYRGLGVIREKKKPVKTVKLPRQGRKPNAVVRKKEFEANAKLWTKGFKRIADKAATTTLDGAHYWDTESDDYLAGLLQSLDVLRDGVKESIARRKQALKKK